MTSRPDTVRRAATWVVAGITLGLFALSVRQVVVRTRAELRYAGMKAMSAPWTRPPSADGAEWRVSEGVVPSPPATANRVQLLRWLRQYYPVLALDLPPDVPPDERRLDLGGGPPRRLYVEPGRGLVGREP